MFIAVIMSTGVCCYIMYYFDQEIAMWSLIMLIVGFLLVDILLCRPLYCLIITLFYWCKRRRAHQKMKKYLEQIMLQREMENINDLEGNEEM